MGHIAGGLDINPAFQPISAQHLLKGRRRASLKVIATSIQSVTDKEKSHMNHDIFAQSDYNHWML